MIEQAREHLKRYYGYDTFRTGQEQIISGILNGKDTLGIMPTGGGKSLCYQIPALMMEGVTVVISPLISLMKDQVDALSSVGIPASYINSSLTPNEFGYRMFAASEGRYRILYVAPERLENERFVSMIKEVNVSLLAVDEAHCISQWGHDFRPSYMKVANFLRHFENRPILAAFTATATKKVQKDIVANLKLQEPGICITGFDRTNLNFSVVRGQDKKDVLFSYVKANAEKAGIIYAGTRKEVERLSKLLREKGYLAGKYHAGMSDEERAQSQEDFIYDRIRVMVATNAFGMGIDKSNVRYVIHYNMPKNIEAYYQEAGRAGRDGDNGECVLLFSAADIRLQEFFIDQSDSGEEVKANETRKLQIMTDYCYTNNCLRKYILQYFGENYEKDYCGNCSSCNDDATLQDVTVDAQKILSCIVRMKENFGATLVAEVLKGSENQNVLKYGFEKLSTYGIMESKTLKELKLLIGFLADERFIALSEGQFPVLKLLPDAWEVLKGNKKVMKKTAVTIAQKVVYTDNGLLRKLKKLRSIIAKEEHVPPYIIFSDSTLKEMSQDCPVSESEMLRVKGIGKRKLQRFGDRFMTIIEEHISDDSDFVDEKTGAIVARPKKMKLDENSSHMVSFNKFRYGMSIDDISRDRNLKPGIVQDHILKCAEEGADVDWYSIFSEDEEKEILQFVEECGSKSLKDIRRATGCRYFQIKAVLCKQELSLNRRTSSF